MNGWAWFRDRGRMVLSASYLLIAVLLLIGVFVGLPARYLPVDLIAGGLCGLCLVAGCALPAERPWAMRCARLVSASLLLSGIVAVTLLGLSLAYLSTLYGPVGSGGALLMGAFAALLTPYLIGIPTLQLWWLFGRER